MPLEVSFDADSVGERVVVTLPMKTCLRRFVSITDRAGAGAEVVSAPLYALEVAVRGDDEVKIQESILRLTPHASVRTMVVLPYEY
jgi:hypothetical protein